MWLLLTFPRSSEFCFWPFFRLSAFQFGNFLSLYLQQAWLSFTRLYPLYWRAHQRHSRFLFLFLFLTFPFESSHHLLLPTCFCMLPTFSAGAINIPVMLILSSRMFPDSVLCVDLMGRFLSSCFASSCLIFCLKYAHGRLGLWLSSTVFVSPVLASSLQHHTHKKVLKCPCDTSSSRNGGGQDFSVRVSVYTGELCFFMLL